MSAEKYALTHEWVRLDGDVYTVGISEHAAGQIGDVVFVELPEVGNTYDQGESFGVIESVKSANDVYLPIAGEVVEINEELEDSPELVNESPLEKGWFCKIKASDASQLDSLHDLNDYLAKADE